MNFLDDSDTCYHYKSDLDEVAGTPEMLNAYFGSTLKFEPGESVTINDGPNSPPRVYTYAGFDPQKMSLMLKVYFDKNGRKAIKSIHSDGTVHIRSETKDRVLEGKDQRESVVTKQCAEATKKYIDNKEKGLMNYYQKTFAGRR